MRPWQHQKPTMFALSLFVCSCSPLIVFCSPALATVRRLTVIAFQELCLDTYHASGPSSYSQHNQQTGYVHQSAHGNLNSDII
ncbi:hypothetical protein PVAP13_1KG326100 [Panicum virgatum]|uniref:Uncharacterized protein n=1 Tax=Panicum virgatum TaxID=38727 RepID=A0A8T0XLT7_PANVG|nr:hypothetical protein PVAP13_1KG326100 [Panicum virgatum]